MDIDFLAKDSIRPNKNGINIIMQCATGFCLLGIMASAQAFKIDTGSDDVSIRWDQTIRYNYGMRMQDRNPRAAASTFARDETEFSFDKGDTIMNRLDLFSEFDLNYQGRIGFRVSGNLWYDAAYGDKSKSNPAFVGAPGYLPNYNNNEYSPYVKRYFQGPSGEFTDAFVWANFDTNQGRGNVKIGRFGLLWGESFFGTGAANSIGASMAPVDGVKATASPGASAKETLMPLNQMALVMPIVENVELDALYTFEYRHSRAPEAGTYFGGSDVGLDGNDNLASAATPRNAPTEGRAGDSGLMLKFTPEWLDGTLSLVYRRYDDKNMGYQVSEGAPGTSPFHYVAARNVELYGVGLNKNIAGVAVGAEISHRKNQALVSPGLLTSDRGMPIGETTHALINATKAFGKTSAWDNATLVGELTWSHLDKITANPARYSGNGVAGAGNPQANCGNVRRIEAGCPTTDAYRLDLLFQPTWVQVLPSIDLSMPLVYQIGLKGNSAAVGSSQNEGSLTYQVGLAATVYNVHFFTLAYTGFDNKHRGTGNGGVNRYINNGSTTYYDKGWLNFSYRTNF